MAGPEYGVMKDGYAQMRNGRAVMFRDDGQGGADCPGCCEPPPPPPRHRYIRAMLCNPTLHTLHPEVPLYVFVGVPDTGPPVCPTPATPVFVYNFLCYTAEFGQYYVRCDEANPDPDPGTICLPPDAEFAGCSASWASCTDDRCTKFAVRGRPCSACTVTGSFCVWADARDLAAMRGPDLPIGCVVVGALDRCWEFRSGDPVYNVDDLPAGCEQFQTGPYASCCICAAQVRVNGPNGFTCEDCYGPSGFRFGEVFENTYRKLVCPGGTTFHPSGRKCCCGPGASYTVDQTIITDQQHPDGSQGRFRDRIFGSFPGSYTYTAERWENGDWVEYRRQEFTNQGRVCSWTDIWISLYDPTADCDGSPDGPVFTSTADGDCNNLSMTWTTVATNVGGTPGESYQQQGTTEIHGTPGSGGCVQGCGSAAIGFGGGANPARTARQIFEGLI